MKKIISLILAMMFVFACFSTVFAESKIRGDINNNEKIDMTDYILCKRAYFSTYDLTEIESARADVNSNGKVDMTDYVLIKRMYFGTFQWLEENEDIDDNVFFDSSEDLIEESNGDTSVESPVTSLPQQSTNRQEDSNIEESIDDSDSDSMPEDSIIEETSEDTTSDSISAEDISTEDTSENEGEISNSKIISYDKGYTYSHSLSTNSFSTSTNAQYCLTDGEKEHSKYFDAQYLGFLTKPDETATVTIDLEKEYYTNKFIAYVYVLPGDGIEMPRSVYLEVSSDNQIWTNVGQTALSTKTTVDDWNNQGTLAMFSLSLNKSALARYVRFSFVCGGPHIMMDELEVYGYSKDTYIPEDDTSGDTSDEETVDETGEDILLCYIAQGYIDNPANNVSLTKEELLPSVGYSVNGQYVDYMYDSFIFLCSPNYLYDWDSNGDAFLRPYTKEDWSFYITQYEFRANRNINALDAAVGEVKDALGDKNHKAKVYMTLFYPVETVTDFGVVDGKNLDFRNPEDRKLGMKWMVDESVRQFNAQNYENIELAGFYWFCEEIYEQSGEGRQIAQYITDYIRTLNMKTAWCPYFLANGYADWQSLGFDIAAMQANYFPVHRTDWPNKGGAERLPWLANEIKKYNLGAGIELADSKDESCKVLKEYMQAGINYSFINSNHIHYMSEGPEVVKELADSSNSIQRSTYDELYKFIKGKLKLTDIKW